MKFFSVLAGAISKIWKFCTSTITICLIAGLVLFCITIFMPDNTAKAIEIVTKLFAG